MPSGTGANSMSPPSCFHDGKGGGEFPVRRAAAGWAQNEILEGVALRVEEQLIPAQVVEMMRWRKRSRSRIR